VERGRLSGLDGLRGIAALGVLSFHIWRVPGGNGYLAVDFFFLLSGYVMARSYEDRLRDGGSGAARAFMAARSGGSTRRWRSRACSGCLTCSRGSEWRRCRSRWRRCC